MALYSYQILMEIEFSREIFEKHLNIKLHENPFSGNLVDPCEEKYRQTERRTVMTKEIATARNLKKHA